MDSELWSLVADAAGDEVGRSWLSAARTWTDGVRGRVMQPFRSAGNPPDAVMVLSDNGRWVEQLNVKVRPSILGVLRRTYRTVTGQEPVSGFDQSQYVTNYLNASVNRMSHTPDQVYRDITRSLAEGTDAGETIPQLAARVEQILTVTGNDTWTNRGVVVSRTEVNAAQNAGTLAAGAQRQITDRQPMVKTWVATTRPPSSLRTRPDHLAADGQTVPLTQPFKVGDSLMQYPGDPTAPANEVIQCFPGWVRASSLSAIRRVYRRWYEGTMIVIETADGVKLPATANHPLLTEAGWKTAQDVDLSDKLIGSTGAEGMGSGQPDIENGPATFDEIYRAAANSGMATRITGIGMDFHGDGANADVDVVTLFSDLGAEGDVSLGQAGCDEILVRAGYGLVDLSDGRSGDSARRMRGVNVPSVWVAPTSAAISFSRQSGTFLEGHVSHADSQSFAPAARRETKLSQSPDDDRPADAELVRHALDRLPGGVALRNVIGIERYAFQGFVFNLETDQGWYIANYTASANCRCSMVIRGAGEAPTSTVDRQNAGG